MKINNLRVALVSAVAMIALQPGAAHAQAWIGQIVGNMAAQASAYAAEVACMSGTPMIDAEVTEARGPALQTMTAYFGAAKAGAPLAPYFNLDKRSRWISGDISAPDTQISAQQDPFARGGVLDASPLGFARAGDGRTAMGQWAVRDASGALAGTYTALFTRKSAVWRFSTLELTPASRYVDPVVQFCHKAGDVMPWRLLNTRSTREILEKRVARTETKAAKAASAKPSPAATARAQRLSRDLETRRKELADARAAEAKAVADAKEAEDRKAAAIAALGGGR